MSTPSIDSKSYSDPLLKLESRDQSGIERDERVNFRDSFDQQIKRQRAEDIADARLESRKAEERKLEDKRTESIQESREQRKEALHRNKDVEETHNRDRADMTRRDERSDVDDVSETNNTESAQNAESKAQHDNLNSEDAPHRQQAIAAEAKGDGSNQEALTTSEQNEMIKNVLLAEDNTVPLSEQQAAVEEGLLQTIKNGDSLNLMNTSAEQSISHAQLNILSSDNKQAIGDSVLRQALRGQAQTLQHGDGANATLDVLSSKGQRPLAGQIETIVNGKMVDLQNTSQQQLSMVNLTGSNKINYSMQNMLAMNGKVSLDSLTGIKLENSFTPETQTSQFLPSTHNSMPQNQLNTANVARVNMPVNITFGQAGWTAEVAEKTSTLVTQNIRFAELQLDPPELGPLQVKVSVNQDQASVSFVVANPSVKDSLDQTVQRLRELLDEQGLDLVDVNVSDQSPDEQAAGHDDNTESGKNGDLAFIEEDMQGSENGNMIRLNAQYGVDHYV